MIQLPSILQSCTQHNQNQALFLSIRHYVLSFTTTIHHSFTSAIIHFQHHPLLSSYTAGMGPWLMGVIELVVIQRMGSQVCETCQTLEPPFHYIPSRAFKSIEEMQSKFKKYAEDNLLSLYGRRMQQTIQKLFTFEQFHLCDLLIRLTTDRKHDQLDQLLQDIDKVDFQELDHLTLVENMPLQIFERMGNVSSLYYTELKDEQLGVRTLKARNIKNKEFSDQILKYMLQTNKFAIVASVECLGNSGAFEGLELPSGKSALQMFVQKVQGVNSRYQCSILVVFIVNPRFEKQLDRQIDKLLKLRDFQQSGDTESTQAEFKYEKILYKPPYPCVNHNRQIFVEGNRIKFDQYHGDFVGFFMKDTRLQLIMQRFDYLQIANLAHLSEELADKVSLVYLQSHPQTLIVAHARPENALSGRREYIKVRRNFVERVKWVGQPQKSQLYGLSQSYYLKAELFFQKDKHKLYHKLISTRIRSTSLQQLGIVFTRGFEDVLYAPITLILLYDEERDLQQIHKEVGYSNFCKLKLGIKDTLDEEIVQVCPQLLFGPREELRKVVDRLKKLPQIGFPLVINKQRVEERSGLRR